MNDEPLLKEKRRKTRHFTAKAAARCVAYARRDGANDIELLKLIFEAFGVSNVPCLLSQCLLVFTNAMFVGSLLVAFNGLLRFVKGAKIFVEGKVSATTITPTDLLIKYCFPNFQSMYGFILIWLATAEVLINTLLGLVYSLADQAVYYYYLDDVCKMPSVANPFPITPPPANFDLFYSNDELQKNQFERFIELTDSLFPDDQ